MRLTRRQLLQVTAASSIALAGCTGGGDGDTTTATSTQTTTSTQAPTSTQSEAEKTIVMENTVFQTLKADVDTGATVKWVNNDGSPHTVTSAQFHDAAKSWSFEQQVAGGGSTTHTFDSQGIYEYYCTIHGKSTMCGAVLVGGATLEKPLPCTGDGGGGDGGDGGGGGYY